MSNNQTVIWDVQEDQIAIIPTKEVQKQVPDNKTDISQVDLFVIKLIFLRFCFYLLEIVLII